MLIGCVITKNTKHRNTVWSVPAAIAGTKELDEEYGGESECSFGRGASYELAI